MPVDFVVKTVTIVSVVSTYLSVALTKMILCSASVYKFQLSSNHTLVIIDLLLVIMIVD